MHNPDLIQRIYFEKAKGNDHNFQKVFNYLRSNNFEHIFQFEFNNTIISWTCFESKQFDSIILEADEAVYFYLWTKDLKFEIVIPGYTSITDSKKHLLERIPFFNSIWVIGEYFPGIDKLGERPIKLNKQHIRKIDFLPIIKLNYLFIKMLKQYASNTKPIFEAIGYSKLKPGEKNWRKIADKRK